MKLSIIIPTYNERESVGQIAEAIHKSLNQDYEIIFVDDDSPDRTADIIRQLDPRLKARVIVRKSGRSLSRSVLEGIKNAQAETVIVMDADLQHPPETIAKLFDRMQETGADIVVASRYAPKASVTGWSVARQLMSKTATLLAKLFLAQARKTTDPLSGFFLIKKSVINDQVKPIGYKILLEILVNGNYQKISEVPFRFVNRKSGTSKLGSREISRFLEHVLKLRFGRRDKQ